MSTNITTASSEYASRPKDERFDSYRSFVAAAVYDRDHSAEKVYNLRDLRAVAVPAPRPEPGPNSGSGQLSPLDTRPESLMLESPRGRAKFTHWSFGQLVRSITPPGARGVANYLRSLPASIAADAMNHGLRDADHTAGQRANLLVKANGGVPIIRAATSDTYGRAWDADLHSVGERYFGDGCRSSQGEWQSPPTWDGQPAGQYRGDRDSFVIRIDGGSIVGDPRGFGAIGGGGGQLNRAIMVRNSEVGASSISLDLILFDKICGNHILWGAVIDSTFKRRHVGSDVAAKAITEILRIARQQAHQLACLRGFPGPGHRCLDKAASRGPDGFVQPSGIGCGIGGHIDQNTALHTFLEFR
jgi:hypothetical protein